MEAFVFFLHFFFDAFALGDVGDSCASSESVVLWFFFFSLSPDFAEGFFVLAF